MPTQEKIETVSSLKARLDGVKTLVLTEYRGLSVQQLSELRKQLRAAAAEYKIVKNRLARLAVSSTEFAELSQHLTGPTGVVFSKQDPVAVAKAIHAFARQNQALAIKAGFVEGRVLQADGLKALADLPSREALRSQIVGAVQGPLAQIVGLLTAAQRDIAYVLAERGKGAAE